MLGGNYLAFNYLCMGSFFDTAYSRYRDLYPAQPTTYVDKDTTHSTTYVNKY